MVHAIIFLFMNKIQYNNITVRTRSLQECEGKLLGIWANDKGTW